MAQLNSYSSVKGNWLWTGVRTLNQMWSVTYISDPILVSSIDIYWGGYDAPTRGRHFIARVDGNNQSQLQGLVALSDWIGVGQGRAFRKGNIPETLLEPGHYAVGVFGDFLGRRVAGEWNPVYWGTIYTVTSQSFNDKARGTAWGGGGQGVLPFHLIYENAGRMHVKVSGSWRKGKATHLKVSGTWRKAKAVWVKSNGVWRRSK